MGGAPDSRHHALQQVARQIPAFSTHIRPTNNPLGVRNERRTRASRNLQDGEVEELNELQQDAALEVAGSQITEQIDNRALTF